MPPEHFYAQNLYFEMFGTVASRVQYSGIIHNCAIDRMWVYVAEAWSYNKWLGHSRGEVVRIIYRLLSGAAAGNIKKKLSTEARIISLSSGARLRLP